MKPWGELLYNLAALAGVATAAHFFFWWFLVVVGTSVLITLSLMIAERIAARE